MNENPTQKSENMAASGSQCSARLGRDGYETWRITYQSSEQAARAAYAEAERLRAALYDGPAVYAALSEKAKRRTSGENVSDVLDAVVRVLRGK